MYCMKEPISTKTKKSHWMDRNQSFPPIEQLAIDAFPIPCSIHYCTVCFWHFSTAQRSLYISTAWNATLLHGSQVTHFSTASLASGTFTLRGRHFFHCTACYWCLLMLSWCHPTAWQRDWRFIRYWPFPTARLAVCMLNAVMTGAEKQLEPRHEEQT